MTKGYFTGVGSRETPDDIVATMEQIAQELSQMGYILRSGHSGPADMAFEKGANSPDSEIYVPWASFNKDVPIIGTKIIPDYNIQSENIAMRMHPNWNVCIDSSKRLLNRNGYQVLGRDLKTRSKFVIGYTPGGQSGGGTGHTLRVSRHFNIPTFDLGSPRGMENLMRYAESNF